MTLPPRPPDEPGIEIPPDAPPEIPPGGPPGGEPDWRPPGWDEPEPPTRVPGDDPEVETEL